MKTYDRYKDSGIDWLGEIPEHWETCNCRYYLDILTDFTANGSFGDLAKNVKYLDVKDYSRLIRLTDLRDNLKNKGVYVNEKSHRYLKKSELFGGEILIANVGAYAGFVVKMPNHQGKCTLGPNMFLTKWNNKFINDDYWIYLLNSAKFYQYISLIATSAAQPKLNKDNIRGLKVILPPILEQEAIATFLDDKCGKIDVAVGIKEQQIDKLKELRQITIHNAVTKGVPCHAELVEAWPAEAYNTLRQTQGSLKNSGIDWIGDIPAHWEVKRLKFVFKILKRIAGRLGHDVLSITQRGIVVKDVTSGEGQLAMDYSKYQYAYEGDFAMNHMDLLTGWVDISKFNGVISPDYRVFQLINVDNYAPYFLHLLQDCYRNKAFYAHGQGVSMLGRWRFPTENFNNFFFPVPPLAEQEAIVAYLDEQTGKIDQAIAQKTEQIAKLKEYKQSLINEVVTGKVRVFNYD